MNTENLSIIANANLIQKSYQRGKSTGEEESMFTWNFLFTHSHVPLPMTLGIFEKTSSILTVDYLLNSCAIKTAYDSAADIVMRILSYVTEKQTKRNRNRANNLCQ